MARRSRRWEPNAIHHAVSRAHCGSPIFAMDEDREFVVARAVRAFEETGATCLAWSILVNHYHVLVRCPGPPGVVFSRLNTAIAWRVLRHRGEHGAVFQNRYFSDPCEDEASLIGRFAYVLGNPVHHRVVPTIEMLCGYQWSGLAELLGRRRARWVDVDAALGLIDPEPEHARRVLVQALERKAAQWAADGGDPAMDRPLDEGMLDSEAPRATPRAESASATPQRPALRPRRATLDREGWTPDRLIEVACAVTGGDPAAVRAGARSRAEAAARSLVAFVACDVAGRTMRETAAFVGVGQTALDLARRRGGARLAALGIDPIDLLARSRGTIGAVGREVVIGDRPR
jgi:REP element-mobilizing transposase RayT